MNSVIGTKLIDSNGRILADKIGQILIAKPYLQSLSRLDIERAIRSYISYPIFKVELLNRDETPFEDITRYISDKSFNYNQDHQSGQVRSISFDLIDKDGYYFPSPIGKIWYGTKIGLSLGLLVDNTVIYFPKGIFAVKEASYNYGTLKIQTVDKFGFLDGTISGTTESKFQIDPNTPVIEAVNKLLSIKDEGGYVYDEKEVFYPDKYKDSVVPYTIKNDYASNIGEIIIELGKIISCTVFYDDYGHLTFEPFNEISEFSNREVVWVFRDGESQYSDTSMDIKFPEVYNKVLVVGSNINGYICKGEASNKNPASATAIGVCPVKFLYIEDSNIYNGDLCQTRADYELQHASLLSTPIRFRSIYIPLLVVNGLIEYTNNKILNGNGGNRLFNNEKLLITSLSFSGDGIFNVSAKNIRELPFNG